MHIIFSKRLIKAKRLMKHIKKVFGAPTFMSNNKIFWGQDRIEFVLNEANK